MVFSEIVEAADGLKPEEQLALVAILQRKLGETNREKLLEDIAEARADFAEGKCHAASVQEVIAEITGEINP